MAVREAKRAQEEISDSTEDAVMYMSVGTVMMQKKKEVVNAKLTEKVETLELRIKSLEKQEKMMQGKFEQLQAQIKAAIEGKGADAAYHYFFSAKQPRTFFCMKRTIDRTTSDTGQRLLAIKTAADHAARAHE
jgi:prefoldin beta subunit